MTRLPSSTGRNGQDDSLPDSASNPQSRRLAIQYVSVGSLKPNPQNPRRHSKKQVRQLAGSIKEFGLMKAILVDSERRVIAGHGLLGAAKLLGLKSVPIVVAAHLSEAQLRAYMIADNKLAENSTWDKDLLAEHFKVLLEVGFNVEVTGYTVGEIDVTIEGGAPASAAEEDPADALPGAASGPPVTCPGDPWLLGPHRVVCGDALEPKTYPVLMNGRLAAAVFTDPPYNDPIEGYVAGFGAVHYAEFAMGSGEMTPTKFTGFLAKGFALLARNSVDGALVYVFMDWRHLGELLAAARPIFSEFKNLCVWVKESGGQGSLYRSQHELCCVFKNGKGKHRNNIQLGQYGRYRTNVWTYPRVNAFARATEEGGVPVVHPTRKPVPLVADAILDCTARGEVVLDGFLGSGTTVIAAERTGRVCYGLEIESAYVDTIVRRWQAFTGREAVHAKSGRTFNKLEEEARHDQTG